MDDAVATEVIFAVDVPSAVTEAEARALCGLAEGQRVLEAGAQFGRSTIAFASVAAMVHSVDWHRGDAWAGELGDTLPAFLANLERHGVRDRVVVHVGRFEDVAPALRDRWFGLVFLDGAHGYEDVRRDVVLFAPKAAAGGYVAFHDFARHEGVTKAVTEWAAAAGLYPIVAPCESLAVVRVR